MPSTGCCLWFLQSASNSPCKLTLAAAMLLGWGLRLTTCTRLQLMTPRQLRQHPSQGPPQKTFRKGLARKFLQLIQLIRQLPLRQDRLCWSQTACRRQQQALQTTNIRHTGRSSSGSPQRLHCLQQTLTSKALQTTNIRHTGRSSNGSPQRLHCLQQTLK